MEVVVPLRAISVCPFNVPGLHPSVPGLHLVCAPGLRQRRWALDGPSVTKSFRGSAVDDARLMAGFVSCSVCGSRVLKIR